MTAEQLAKALGGRRSGRQFVCRCPAHEDTSPSLILFDGHQAVQLRCLAGCSPRDVINELRRRGLWDGHGDAVERSPIRPTRVGSAQEVRMVKAARRIFEAPSDFIRAPGLRYLEQRGDLSSVARECPDIRFHPACPRGSLTQPAIIVAMRSFATGEVTAVQRIFLMEDVFGNVSKDGAQMLGAAAGAAMQLKPPADGKLAIAEGLETALAVMALDYGPCWAVGSASLMRVFPVLDGVDKLLIFADHDRAGVDAALRCRERWLAAGRAVKCLTPEIEGRDANDVWRDRLARQ